jgi:hypothetical protein
MGFPINLGGLWRPKLPGKSICSGSFTLPAALILDAARGHKFVIKAHDKQGNSKAPDYDLLLFSEDENEQGQSSGFDPAPKDFPATDGVPSKDGDNDVPF